MTQNQEKEIKANNSKDPKMTQMLETADKNLQRDMKYLFKNLKEKTVFFQVGGAGRATRLWDLSSETREPRRAPAGEVQSLNHWTTREVPEKNRK